MVLDDLAMIDVLGRHFFVTLSDAPSSGVERHPGWCTLVGLLDAGASVRLPRSDTWFSGPRLLLWGPEPSPDSLSTHGAVICLDFHPGEINELFFEHEVSGDPIPRAALNDRYLLENFLTGTGAAPVVLALGPTQRDRISGLFSALQDELSGKPNGYWPCRSRSYLLELLIFVRHLKVEERPPSLAQRLQSHLHAHYAEVLRIDELAHLLGTNRTTLSAQFKAHSGVSVITYLNQLRMQVAASLLRDTTLPISEVLERIGVHDLSRFGRLFKAQWGLPPGEYRRQENWVFPHLVH